MPTPCFFDPRWPVLHEDPLFLALYKPSGLLAQADCTGDVTILDLAERWLKERCQKPGRAFVAPVHRLDRPVAGALLVARTSKAASRLAAQFREGGIRKTYLAVVEGGLARGAAMHLTDRVEKHGTGSRIARRATQDSREARLSFTVIETLRGRSLIEIHLETGRRHQIRLQLSRLGFPVLGDTRYGAGAALPRRRIALLAREISFHHPTRPEETITAVSPVPRGFPWPDLAGEDAPPWGFEELAPALALPHPCAPPPSVQE